MLVAEFTLTENPANTTTSQLKAVCHADDAILLGTWLQETDHGTIEDQVRLYCVYMNNTILRSLSEGNLCLMLRRYFYYSDSLLMVCNKYFTTIKLFSDGT